MGAGDVRRAQAGGGTPAPAEHPPTWAEDDLSGWQLLMTDVGCFTGLTALEVHGVPLPPLPEWMPRLPRPGQGRPAADAKRRAHEPPRPAGGARRRPWPAGGNGPRGAHGGGAVARRRRHGRADRRGDLPRAGLARASWRRSQGPDDREAAGCARRCRWWTVAPSPCGSPCSALLHVVCDIEVEPQWDLVDADGVLVARADLWVVGTNALHEFDGDEHEKAPRRVGDRRRDRRVDRAGIRTPRLHRGRRHSPGGDDPRGRRPVAGARPRPHSDTGVARAPPATRCSRPRGGSPFSRGSPWRHPGGVPPEGGGRSPTIGRRMRRCAATMRDWRPEGGGRSGHGRPPNTCHVPPPPTVGRTTDRRDLGE